MTVAETNRCVRARCPWFLVWPVAVACQPTAVSTTPPPDGSGTTTSQQETVATSQGEDPASTPSFAFMGDENTVKAKQAFTTDACGTLCEGEAPEDCRCEVTQDLGDWFVLRLADKKASGFGWYWYVAAATKPGYRLLAPSDVDLPPYNEDPAAVIYELCSEYTADGAPPTDSGLVAAEVRAANDEDDDPPREHPVLRLECNNRDLGEHYWIECPASDDRCDKSPPTSSN